MTNQDKLKEIESTFEESSKLNTEASKQTDNLRQIIINIKEFGTQKADEAYLKCIACNMEFFEYTSNNMKFMINELKNVLEATNAPELLSRLLPDSLEGIFDWRHDPDMELNPLELFDKMDAKARIVYLRQMTNHRICIANAINLVQIVFLPQLINYYKI